MNHIRFLKEVEKAIREYEEKKANIRLKGDMAIAFNEEYPKDDTYDDNPEGLL